MPKYLATQRYASSYLPGGVAAGEVIDLTEAEADAINRDSPGTLVPNPEGVAEPASDRQMKAPPQRRDRGEQSPIDKATFKAVKGNG